MQKCVGGSKDDWQQRPSGGGPERTSSWAMSWSTLSSLISDFVRTGVFSFSIIDEASVGVVGWDDVGLIPSASGGGGTSGGRHADHGLQTPRAFAGVLTVIIFRNSFGWWLWGGVVVVVG